MDSRIICLAGHFARLGGMEAADAFSLNADAAIACDVYGLLVDKKIGRASCRERV